MNTTSPVPVSAAAGPPRRHRLLGVGKRYWRLGLACGGTYAVVLVTLALLRAPDQPARLVFAVAASALFGAVMAAMFGYFEKKSLARLGIDADTAFELNIFAPVQNRTIAVETSRQATFQRACDTLAAYGAVIERRDEVAGTVEAVTFQNWRSYGERLTVEVTGNGPCAVSIRSVPRIYLLKLVTNYGRSWEHVQALAAGIAGGALAAPAGCGEVRTILSGNAANTPPAVMEAGAWQRLLALTLMYGLMLPGLSQPGKSVLVVLGFATGLGLEAAGYLRFRRQVRERVRSDAQETVESMLNNVWPALFAPILLADPRLDWFDGKNVAAMAVAGVFLLIAINRLREKSREREQRAAVVASREKAELERQLAEARLVALSAQIEPHFLFNTLANIQYLIRNDAAKAADMTSDLIRYLRLALPRMKQSTARLADELDLVRAYLGIMKIRMGERLSFAIDEPDDLADADIPTMALITLVENAIKHGLEQQSAGGAIRVSIAAAADQLALTVADTGGGFSTAASGTGIGLTNIRERLRTLYGERGQLSLEANHPTGVKATLIVPRSGR